MGAAGRQGLEGGDVGDRVRFDILGRPVVARVTSVRDVEWKDSRNGGFMFVFRPGVLDQAPHTYLAPLRGPAASTARTRMQHALVERFPNVTVIDFREILLTVQDVMSKVTLAISVVGGLVDRLVVLPDRVLVADFKTNRRPSARAEDAPVAYLRQMAAYRAVLRGVFPGREVACALIWTREARAMPLPDALLDAHAPDAGRA